jgi:hypothetical protein
VDSLYWGNFRVSQMLAAFTCFAAVGTLMYFHFFKQPDPNNMQVRLYEAQQEAQKEEKKNG